MKLVVGIPTAGKPAEPFLQSLRELALPPAVTFVENKSAMGNFVPAQRELLAEFALAQGADFLMMADDDMVIPRDAIADLLEPFADPRTGVTGALCYSRDGLRPMAVSGWDPQDTTSAAIPAFDDRTPVEVDGVGFGLVMIRVSLFATFHPPYFPVQIYLERAASRVRVCNEDFLFCKRVRDAGFTVRLHPGVRCGHYDRETKITQPIEWENPAQTSHQRMLVRRPDGEIAKIPYDAQTGRARELHRKAELDYIIVE